MGMPAPEVMTNIIISVVLILSDIILLKIGLTITKAQEKKGWKWVAGSFAIQFLLVFFIGSPLMIWGLSGDFDGDPGVIAPIILLAIFIDFNLINVIHKIGMKRSLIVVIFVVGPLVGALYLLGSSVPNLAF